MQNYLSPGTSLRQFYESQQVETPKGYFPYQIFDGLECFDWTSLPERDPKLAEAMENLENDPDNHQLAEEVEFLSKTDPFYSTLTNRTISNEELGICIEAWEKEGMETFADFVEFYNNADVIGFTEALTKYLKLNESMKLDVFKMSISLPGLTKRYLFQNLAGDEYFSGFGEEHKWLVKELRNSITGGPSIIFHRYQEQMKTIIKGIEGNFCQNVYGFDAYCFG